MISRSIVLMSMYCIVYIAMHSPRSKAASIACHNESYQMHLPYHSIKEQWLISMNLMSRLKTEKSRNHDPSMQWLHHEASQLIKLCVFLRWMMPAFLTIWWNQEVNLLCVSQMCRSLQDLLTRQLSLLQHPTIPSLWFNQPSQSLIEPWSLLIYAVDTI